MKYLYLLLFIVVTAYGASAQLSYTFSAVSGTYAPVTGGTNAVVISGQAGFDTHDEGIANGIPIGFAFNYNGVNYSTINGCTNGFASFKTLLPVANAATQDYYTSDLGYGPYGPANARPLLAPLWDDLDLFATSDLKYKTENSAPNRVFTLEWGQAYWDYSADNINMAFQLKLFETTNVIEFHYQQLAGAIGYSPAAAIGITATDTGRGNYLSLNNASSSPVASSTVNTYTIATKPATGQIYRFSPASTLALTVTSFSGEKNISTNTLKWTTKTEQNLKGFELERSADGVHFSTIAVINSKSPSGSSQPLQYLFEDMKPFIGNNYYRLKQVNSNGSSSFSSVILLQGKTSSHVEITNVFPNPASDYIGVIVSAPVAENIAIIITDVSGKSVFQKNMGAVTGDNYFQVDVRKLSRGNYLIKATNSLGECGISKFIKQ